jgi:hypothetical protein
MQILRDELQADFVEPYMPLQDAVELATYLVAVSEGFTRFNPGPDTVGGPIEVAAISKHEGFKWVQRKHYYTTGLNPPAGAEMAEEFTEILPRFQEMAHLLRSMSTREGDEDEE